MNIFRTLFRPQPTEISSPPPTLVPGTPPPEELFTDNHIPTPDIPDFDERDTPIAVFLRKDYQGMGMHDGFEYHNHEHLQATRRRLRAEFMTMLDQVILERREYRRMLQDRMVDIAPIAEDMHRKLHLVLDEMNHVLDLLERQKALAIEEEGWLMQVLHAYQQGFLKGVQDRLESDSLLTRLQLL